VTGSSRCPAAILSLSPFGRLKEPPLPLQICPPATPSFQIKKIVSSFDDELRGPRAVSPLQVGPPTPSRVRSPSPHLRSRSATRSRPFAVQPSSKRTCVNRSNPRMSRSLFPVHNLRADLPPPIVSTEHRVSVTRKDTVNSLSDQTASTCTFQTVA
jgi:hypothetical protein